MRPVTTAPALGALLLLSACGIDYDVKSNPGGDDLGAGIEVDPERVDFGLLDAGESSAAEITVTNVGTATLLLEGLLLEGSTAFTLTSDHMLDSLEPEESTRFTVTIEGTGDTETGNVVVQSSDPVSPEVDVPLTAGSGPILEWDQDPLSFDSLDVGDSDMKSLTMTNVGSSLLTIEALTLDGDEFEADFPDLPLDLEAGESSSFDVTFHPDSSGSYSGTITANSNADEDNEVALTGGGGSQPVAVCSVDPEEVSSHRDTANWIGEESYDPGGSTITDYNWTLYSQPAGSTATMPSGGSNRRGFVWDLAGEYVGELVVVNAEGVESEPCYATLTAKPGDDFWIELYWAHSGDDMDLHLLAPGGVLETGTDCYFANCTGAGLDWGVRGDDADNPSLDLDDIPGTGPENIRIEDPEDGEYTVVVHDYPTTVYSGSNAVTVSIYIDGVLEWSDTRNISGENTTEEFAVVEFPGGTITTR